MTNIAIPPASAPLDAGAPRDERDVPRSWLARAMLDTVGKTSARLGLIWISVIAFCAVFAPFIANSYPILVKMNGRYSSPMAKHFTPTDVTLLVMTFAAIVLLVFM